MATVHTTQRIWVIGATRLPCPFNMLPFKQAFEMLTKQKPQLRHTAMYESDGVPQENGEIVFTVPLIPPKTNG